MTNGEAMTLMYRELRTSDQGVRLARIHDRIVAAIHLGDKAGARRARRCYRRALASVARVERWRHRNGFSS